jgi:putative transposase
LRQTRPKRNKAAQLRQPKKLALHINQIWSMDFVADNLFDGRKLRMLTVVDCYTRESLDIHVDQSLKGEDVVRVLNNIVAARGKPMTIKTDNELNAIGFTTKRQSSSRLQLAVKKTALP